MSFSIGLGLLAGLADSAQAQALEEVVVVARKKTESLQKVPSIIQMFDQTQLE